MTLPTALSTLARTATPGSDSHQLIVLAEIAQERGVLPAISWVGHAVNAVRALRNVEDSDQRSLILRAAAHCLAAIELIDAQQEGTP